MRYMNKSFVLDVVGHVSKYTIAPLNIILSSVYDYKSDPFKIIYVDPDQINYYGGEFDNKPHKYGERFSLAYFIGSEVRGGIWDLHVSKKKIEDMKKYQAVEDRFINNDDWQETGIFDYIGTQLQTTGEYDGCTSIEEVKNRYKNIDELYKSINEEGYKELEGIDQVCVNIGRDGEIIFNGNGKHRLSIAKVLNIDEIPVRVLVRHKDWQELRKQIVTTSSYEELNDRAKDYLTHPDLQDILPSSYLDVHNQDT